MGRLSKQEYTEGQQFVAHRDLQGLLRWARSLGIVTLDLDELERAFAREFRKPTLDRALGMFQRYFATVDRDEEYRAWRFNLVQWMIYSVAFGVGMFWMLLRTRG